MSGLNPKRVISVAALVLMGGIVVAAVLMVGRRDGAPPATVSFLRYEESGRSAILQITNLGNLIWRSLRRLTPSRLAKARRKSDGQPNKQTPSVGCRARCDRGDSRPLLAKAARLPKEKALRGFPQAGQPHSLFI